MYKWGNCLILIAPIAKSFGAGGRRLGMGRMPRAWPSDGQSAPLSVDARRWNYFVSAGILPG